MKPAEFVAKWSRLQQKETALYASHFDDVCRLVGHATPTEHAARHDPEGKTFSFQTSTVKADGQKGFADVFFRDHFIWEYKGVHADLNKAYRQLQLYREALFNPPLLITSDLRTIHIYSNFTNRPTVETVVTLDDIAAKDGGAGPGVDVLRRVFFHPDSFRPDATRETITRATADTFLSVAEALRQHQRLTDEAYTPEQRAHFLIRLLFCLFAEDLGLLPDGLFTSIVQSQGAAYTDLRHPLRNLFATMRDGGHFGMFAVRHFNGTLFDDAFVPALPYDLAGLVLRAARQDWAAVDPSIFGTLFERIIDEDKRAQLGAHYTSQDDILLIVEPVLMAPLRRKWDEVRRTANYELGRESRGAGGQGSGGEEEPAGASFPPAPPLPRSPAQQLEAFAKEIAAVRVLDPACGSGNFLYVALRRLLDLQKEVISYAARKGLPPIPLTVGPQQLYGIEINDYAHELAQITVWIGYLQWRYENGFAAMDDPVLRPLDNIRHMDAILAHDADGRPVEPAWPAAEVIIGNPPFLGSRMMRPTFGDKYCNSLQEIYKGRIDGLPDLVCYWFEKARSSISTSQSQRVGLIATNSIRGGSNRRVLDNVKRSGDIFMAWSDHEWQVAGAAVRVSIVGFDNGSQNLRFLDGRQVADINADLTSETNFGQAQRLQENRGISFQGVVLRGNFRITESEARTMIASPNPEPERQNTEVIRLRYNGQDITGRPENIHIIDFGVNTSVEEAAKYVVPFQYVRTNVYPERQKANQAAAREKWWLHWNPRPDMKRALASLPRYIATPTVAKHRLFVWLGNHIHPDHQLIAIARDDDYFFGVLHARPHELWALRMGTSGLETTRATPPPPPSRPTPSPGRRGENRSQT
jgi:hypothetical protein